MKTLIAVASVLVLAAVAYAGTSGGTAPAVGKVNVSLTVPKASKAACKTLAAGARATQTFDVSGTTMVSWKAFTSDYSSTAVTLKRALNSNTAYVPSTGESNLPIESNVSALTFSAFSSASPASSKICVDLN